jgi:hypothetical protein
MCPWALTPGRGSCCVQSLDVEWRVSCLALFWKGALSGFPGFLIDRNSSRSNSVLRYRQISSGVGSFRRPDRSNDETHVCSTTDVYGWSILKPILTMTFLSKARQSQNFEFLRYPDTVSFPLTSHLYDFSITLSYPTTLRLITSFPWIPPKVTSQLSTHNPRFRGEPRSNSYCESKSLVRAPILRETENKSHISEPSERKINPNYCSLAFIFYFSGGMISKLPLTGVKS